MSVELGTVLAVGGAAYGAVNSALAAKKKRLYLDNYEREALNDINNDIYKDYMQTATAQAGMTRMRKLGIESNQSLAGQQAVMGGNRAAVAEKKQSVNDNLAQMGSNIVVNGEQQAQQARDAKRQIKQNIASQRLGIYQQQADAVAKASGQLVGAGLNIVGDAMQRKLMLNSNADGADKGSTPNEEKNNGVSALNTIGTQKSNIGNVYYYG